MVKKKTEEIVKDLALPILNKHQVELIDIVFKKEGPNWYLRLFVDKSKGINLGDCQLISDSLSEILDEVDPIEQSYILEVSSPGIDRHLKTSKDYERYKGYKVEIKLYAPYNGQKKYIGELIGLIDNHINLEVNDNDRVEIPLHVASSVRLYVEF